MFRGSSMMLNFAGHQISHMYCN